MSFDRTIVIDTGVLISAAIRPQSVPALALERALRHYEVCASLATLGELQQVLLRPKFDRYAGTTQRQAFLDGIMLHLHMVEVTQHITECPDPKDDKFLALALAANAELIIASDPHLTQMHPWRSIPILPPAAFLVGSR
ncbi:MAG: putative toxin-antitoxin system toxin component, PIN family [Burkholderiales bacterium]